jgi:hypothetical protein
MQSETGCTDVRETFPAIPLTSGVRLQHSKWDGLLIALSFVHGALLLAVPSIPLVAIGLWWNANTVSHYFIHLPFFRRAGWNRVYALYLSGLLGFPHSFWRERHLAHHLGRPGRASKSHLTQDLLVETFLVLSLWAILLSRSPALFLTVYVPGYAAGLAVCYVHGYFEHDRGIKSNYGLLYNTLFFNDGYHIEHHLNPARHWTRLPAYPPGLGAASRWPAVLRWMETIPPCLEILERLVLRSARLQRFLLQTHERALRRLLPEMGAVRSVEIVGGGMFPRTALLSEKLIPEAAVTIIDGNPRSIESAKAFLTDRTRFVNAFFDAAHKTEADLLVIPLSYIGDRPALYRNPAARNVLIHDWIWQKRNESVVVSVWLLKRMNLIRR